MSARVLGNTSLTRFDALIIGSGASGGAVAAMLTANGLDVLVLEAGANHFDGLDGPSAAAVVPRFSNDELKLAWRNFIDPHELAEPRTFRKSEADGDRTFVGSVSSLPKTVGGAAVHADVKTPRFLPDDFHLGTLLGEIAGASFADWPVDYDALEPFYGWAEQALGVQGDASGNPFEPPRSTAYPMPPGLGMYGLLRVADGARALGYHPYPYPTAVNSIPYDGRPACVDCGMCSGYGCPSNAKGSPAVTTLRRALLTGHCQVRSETRAVRLLVSATGTEITGVETIGPDGENETFVADRYVLAASPIEDARLLMLSDPMRSGAIGNSSGLVGRNATFHFQTVALGIFDERVHGDRGRAVTHGIVDFRGVPNDPDRPLGGIVEFGSGVGPVEEAKRYAHELSQRGPRLLAMMRQSPVRDRVVALTMQAEDAPQPTNRVDLDPAVRDVDRLPVARLTYRSHAFELSARDYYSPKLLDILEMAGARYCAIVPADEIPATAHVMGTLRFGSDPATSVCDPTGRFHDIGNLWAADGSLFPTSSGFNPILTIVTLAARVGAEIVFPRAPERALR